MTKWNGIKFDAQAEPEVKALEFDLQYAENQRDAQRIAEAQANNCTRPPHFPPHCGCPAG